jgi:hypothetical protein
MLYYSIANKPLYMPQDVTFDILTRWFRHYQKIQQQGPLLVKFLPGTRGNKK